MTNNQKDICQFTTAIGLVCSGVLLIFLCYFQSKETFQDFTLAYMGLTLAFAGATFGFTLWATGQFSNQNSKIADMQHRMQNMIRSNNDNIKNNPNNYDDERD